MNYADEFFGIANDLVSREADEYLDKRLAAMEQWRKDREAHGVPADLRSLIEQVMQEPNQRGPVLVALCAALWRLREKEQDAD